MSIQPPSRARISEFAAALVVLGAVLGLLFVILLCLKFGNFVRLFFLLPLGIYFLVFLLTAIGAMRGQRLAGLALSLLLVLQAIGLVLGVIYARRPLPGLVCDFSCYATPLKVIALPVVLSLIAAWAVYPGWRRTAE